MKTLIGTCGLYLLIFSVVLETLRAADDIGFVPVAVTGQAATTKEHLAAARQTLGDHGCLAIRSAARWKAVETQLVELGWTPPIAPNLAELDFEKQMLIFVHKIGDDSSTFALHKYVTSGEGPQLIVVMGQALRKAREEVGERCSFVVGVLPRHATLDVTVSTYMPGSGSFYPTPEASRREWNGVLGAESGDVVDSLRGKIAAEKLKITAGEDILVQFTLEHTRNRLMASEGRFEVPLKTVSVWDGKYSNGYRNHAFEVRTPDGKTHLLRPKEILDWDKNSPHPIAIKPGAAYVLPEWQEGTTHKSLAALGLDTSKPGKYQITGIYSQTAGTAKWNGAEHTMWGGTIATNTIEVEVVER
jgi:hypothetical protein